MKVWQKINNMMLTFHSKEDILDWMICSKICPVGIMEHVGDDDSMFEAFAENHCSEYTECGLKCYQAFLDKDYPGDFVVNVVDGFKDTIEELIQTFDVTVGKLLHTRDTLYNLLDDMEVVKEFVENEQANEG